MKEDASGSVSLLFTGKEWWPVAPLYFKIGQDPKRQLVKKGIGDLIVTRDGVAKRIKSVSIHGYYGDNWWIKILSVLYSVYYIIVDYDEPYKIDLEEFKKMVITYLQYDYENNSEMIMPQVRALDEVYRAVRNAKSVEEVFDQINIPNEEDCLDVY